MPRRHQLRKFSYNQPVIYLRGRLRYPSACGPLRSCHYNQLKGDPFKRQKGGVLVLKLIKLDFTTFQTISIRVQKGFMSARTVIKLLSLVGRSRNSKQRLPYSCKSDILHERPYLSISSQRKYEICTTCRGKPRSRIEYIFQALTSINSRLKKICNAYIFILCTVGRCNIHGVAKTKL